MFIFAVENQNNVIFITIATKSILYIILPKG